MRPLSRSLLATALAVLAALLLAAPADAVKPRGKLKALGPVELVKPFKGRVAKPRPLASASALFPHGGFLGAGEPACCHTPSRIGGAVGPAHVMQVDAARITIFDRNGAQKQQKDPATLCGPGSETRVLYDRFLDRWFMVLISGGTNQALCVYTSRTSSATGAYHAVGYPLPGAGGSSRQLRIGMDTDGLFIVWDQHNESNAYARTGATALSKAYLVKGVAQNPPLYDALPRLVPPVVVDASRPRSYFLAAGPQTNQLQLFEATAMHRAGALTPKTTVPVAAYAGAVIADQPDVDENLLVDTADFQNHSYQTGGELVNAHTISRNGKPTVRWYAINLETFTIARSGRLFESNTSDDFSPSVAAYGDSVFFSWASTDARSPVADNRHGPAMRFAAYKLGDASTNKQGVFAANGGPYVPEEGSDSRWIGGQVTLAPQGFSSGCGHGSYAFAVGQFTYVDEERWHGYVKKFGTC